VKKSVLALLMLAACGPATTTTTTKTGPIGAPPAPVVTPPKSTNSGMTGAATPRDAVSEFLTAVHAQDIQAMGAIFGTSRGPSRDNMDRNELEKRLIILQCYFDHDKFRIVGDTPGENGHRVVATELTRGTNIRTPSFWVVQGPGNRFYIDNMEIAAVRDFCRSSGGT
jgi:hypothetical protein